MRRQGNLEEPKSIDEARQRLIDTRVEIDILSAELECDFRLRADGSKLTPEELLSWRIRASGVRNFFLRERRIVESYIAQYERDVAAEERAEQQRNIMEEMKQTLGEDKYLDWLKKQVPSSMLSKQLQEEKRHLKQESHEALIQQAQALAQEKRRKNLELHLLEEQRKAEIVTDGPIDPTDPINLLRHLYTMLLRLSQGGRVELTPEEWSVIGVVSDAARLGHFETHKVM